MVPIGAWGQIGFLVQIARFPHRYPVRRLAPFSATSSPLDKPGRFGYLHTSLSALHHSDALSWVKIAISRDLPQSRLLRLVEKQEAEQLLTAGDVPQEQELSDDDMEELKLIVFFLVDEVYMPCTARITELQKSSC